jgi:hypothetical protein
MHRSNTNRDTLEIKHQKQSRNVDVRQYSRAPRQNPMFRIDRDAKIIPAFNENPVLKQILYIGKSGPSFLIDFLNHQDIRILFPDPIRNRFRSLIDPQNIELDHFKRIFPVQSVLGGNRKIGQQPGCRSEKIPLV